MSEDLKLWEPNLWYVDDEASLRALANLRIRQFCPKATITCYESGLTALADLDKGTVLGILLTDLNMPAINGGELIIKACEKRPGLVAVLLSANPGEAEPLARQLKVPFFEKNELLLHSPQRVLTTIYQQYLARQK